MQRLLFIISIFSVIIIQLGTVNVSSSQNIILKTEKVSQDIGISGDLVYCMYQDSKGFIWFGTMFGLVRYDGNEYKTFRYDPLDSNSLSNDDIISIFEDKDGNIWCGTYFGGLNRYDRSSGKFSRYLHSKEDKNSIGSNTVWDITQDPDGIMWFATQGGGLNKYEDGIFTSYKNDSLSNSISGNFVLSIASDKDGNIWVGLMGFGLNKYDKKTNTFTHYSIDTIPVKKMPDMSGQNNVSSILIDTEGELWIGTRGKGLCNFNKSTGEITSYKFEQDSTGRNAVSSVIEDSPGILLAGTSNGLYKFYKEDKRFDKIEINTTETGKKEDIMAILKDRSGVIWANSYPEALYKIQYRPEKFNILVNGSEAECIFEDKSGRLWIGIKYKGLMMSEDGGKNFIGFKNNSDKNSISSNSVTSVTEDNSGNIWIGTVDGLNKLSPDMKTFTKYYKTESNENSISSNNVLKVYCDKSGIIWAGTDAGLNKFVEADGSFIQYQNSRSDTNSLSENTILSIYEDKYNEFWVGTYFGLNKLDRKTGKFKHYRKDPGDSRTISNNYVYSFCEDSNNNFWIGTGGGLNTFDRKTETFFSFTERDGLPNDVIAGIEEGNDGYLWVSTMKGISKLSVKDKTFKNFDVQDGLPGNKFITGSYFKTRKDEILFGSTKGLAGFKPGDIIESDFDLPVIFTELIKYEGNSKKEVDISAIKEIELNYNENILNLGFSSQDYSNPAKIKYAYMLEGFDNDWNYSGNKNEAVYTNLDPGEYIFKVKATNSDGVWSEKESSLILNVMPPFWKTWWFYLLIITILIGAALFIHNLRVRAKVKRMLELERIRENERELMREQASRDYHDELGHKLTRISLYSRRINKKLRPTANGLTEDLNSIVDTTNSLQSGAKDLIWAMNPKEDTLYDFTVRLKDFGNELFENTGINFMTEGFSDEYRNVNLHMNSKRHLIYIFKEGMNNILKYSRCSNVKLSFHYDNNSNELEVTLKDDGIGFDPAHCTKGYGLRNIYSRSKQIDAGINIFSEDHKGTAIKLNIKLEKMSSGVV
ncbi:MAG TPA: two-component regulator propeller domain-containing protein [Ignavibacteria bacterium]|nr:two-component regulator propeller domain-containing protein [Ignavibacteria bacterium]